MKVLFKLCLVANFLPRPLTLPEVKATGDQMKHTVTLNYITDLPVWANASTQLIKMYNKRPVI